MKTKMCVLVSLLAVVSLILVGCGGQATPTGAASPITIAYSGFATSNDFWNTLGKAAAAEAAAKGVNFIDLTTETQDAAAQKAAGHNAITQGVDLIIIGSVDNRVWGDTIE
jgi:ABC-type sugar transport system substrate-binding protein